MMVAGPSVARRIELAVDIENVNAIGKRRWWNFADIIGPDCT